MFAATYDFLFRLNQSINRNLSILDETAIKTVSQRTSCVFPFLTHIESHTRISFINSNCVLLEQLRTLTRRLEPQDGSSYSYTESVAGDLRTITTNHCPNHNWISLNPNYPISGSGNYNIPVRPNLMTSQTTSLVQKGGKVGVLLNGAMIYSPFAGGDSLASDYSNDYANSASALEGDTFDFSGQHGASSTDAYVLSSTKILIPSTNTHTYTDRGIHTFHLRYFSRN